MVEEARDSALSRLAGVTRKSLVRRLSSLFDSRGPRCILICTLTDSFPILIYKQITPLFKFSSPASFCKFRGLSLIPRFPALNFFLALSVPFSFSPFLFLIPTKSPLVILSLKTTFSLSQLHLRSQCSLVISTASSCARLNLLLGWRRAPFMAVQDPPSPSSHPAPNLARICMEPFPVG